MSFPRYAPAASQETGGYGNPGNTAFNTYPAQGGYNPGGGYPPTASGQAGGYGNPGNTAFNTYPAQGGYNPGGGYPPTASGQAGGYGEGYVSAHSGNNHLSDVFFAAACCIIIGSFIGGITLFFSFEPVDFMLTTYLMSFGLLLAVLDTPWLRTIKAVMDAKMYIGKYVAFVTRVTFRGVTLIFLSSALFMTLWYNIGDGFVRFLAVVLCMFPTLVGFGAVVIGLLKSSKLDKARRQLELSIDQRYDEFAQTFRGPGGGLTMDEFNSMTNSAGGFKFEKLDLKLIFNALVSNPSWRAQMNANAQSQGGYSNAMDDYKLSKTDLQEWCRGTMVFL